jgi:hypothetical protein
VGAAETEATAATTAKIETFIVMEKWSKVGAGV